MTLWFQQECWYDSCCGLICWYMVIKCLLQPFSPLAYNTNKDPALCPLSNSLLQRRHSKHTNLLLSDLNHRIPVAWCRRTWKIMLGSNTPTTGRVTSHLSHQGTIQSCLEHFQAWNIHCFSGQAAPVSHHPLVKKIHEVCR